MRAFRVAVTSDFLKPDGSCGFGDPKTGVAAGYVMSKHSHYVAGDPRSLRLIEALYDCL